jgi:hypothetical protein
MSQSGMSLDQLDDRPELTVAIGGQTYHFSELPIARLADLQALIRRLVPHPVDAVKAHLAGLAAEDRQALLSEALREARSWPPQAGTAAGMATLMSAEEGQVAALAAGLSVHHPELGAGEVTRLYRQLQRQAVKDARRAKAEGRTDDGEGLVARIFSVIFGFGDPELKDELPVPES